jgi:hypothetical protein
MVLWRSVRAERLNSPPRTDTGCDELFTYWFGANSTIG